MNVFLLFLAAWIVGSVITALILGPVIKSASSQYPEVPVPVEPEPHEEES
jgi:hypothetical protein